MFLGLFRSSPGLKLQPRKKKKKKPKERKRKNREGKPALDTGPPCFSITLERKDFKEKKEPQKGGKNIRKQRRTATTPFIIKRRSTRMGSREEEGKRRKKRGGGRSPSSRNPPFIAVVSQRKKKKKKKACKEKKGKKKGEFHQDHRVWLFLSSDDVGRGKEKVRERERMALCTERLSCSSLRCWDRALGGKGKKRV